MFNEKHYVPILKWKKGERIALRHLSTDLKSRLTPLIEIAPIDWDYNEECPSKTLSKHLENIGEQLLESWGAEPPVFIDLSLLEPSDQMDDGIHPLTFIRQQAMTKKIKIIPVTGANRDDEYQREVNKANKEDAFGICFRITDDDLDDIEYVLGKLLNSFDVHPEQVDLLIDFDYIPPEDAKKIYISIKSVLNSIPEVDKWRTLTLAGTSFPENLGGFESFSTEEIPRIEWLIWKTLISKKDVKRPPTFGDYGISNPKLTEIDPRLMRGTANIRYTLNESWLILKGGQIKLHGWEQIYYLAEQLVNDKRYFGQTHCYGDAYIFESLAKKERLGGYEVWRRIGTNHHLTLVINQIASFFSP